MRKTIVTALVVLLVMLAVSCDNIPIGENEDGLVTLTVDTGGITGNSRSITDAIARSESEYVEVIFKNGSKYYRAEGILGLTLQVKIPVGHYPDGSTNDAIILIGNAEDKTLLATGSIIPDTDLAGTPYMDVITSTKKIQFKVCSLVTDITTTIPNPRCRSLLGYRLESFIRDH